MENKVYIGVFGCLYKMANNRVYASVDDGETWGSSRYGFDLEFFQDGINKGYLVELKRDE